MLDYYNDPGFPSDRAGVCPYCDGEYSRGDLIATATPKYWRTKPNGWGKIRMAHRECAIKSRLEERDEAEAARVER